MATSSHTTKLTLHAYDWTVKDEADDQGHVVIHGWCLDRDSKPHLVRFHDFPAYCQIELPLYVGRNRVDWTAYKADQVFQNICYILGDRKPFKHFFTMKEKLYYYRGGRKYPMITVLFKSLRDMYECKNRLSKPINVRDIGLVAVKVLETKIPFVRKLLTLRNMNYCQWFTIEGVKATGDDKISKLEHEYVADRSTLNPIPTSETSGWVTHPTILSYDIETYSDRHKALPDPYSSKHVAYMISLVFQRLGDPGSRKVIIILYGDCNPTEMGEIIRVPTEIAGFDKFAELVNEYDPDILTGYNIFSYDNTYMDTRLKRRLRDWKPMGRLLYDSTELISFSWGSSGYGHNEINIIKTEGRIMIDLLPIIRRDYKLSLYNLGYVSNFFLGRTKHPVTAKYMFESYELSNDSQDTPDKTLREYVEERMQWIKQNPDVNSIEDLFKKLHVDQFMKADNDEIDYNLDNIPAISLKEHAMEDMKKVVDYCIVDSVLVLDIFEKIHCWIALIEMSNVVGVTPVELFTRGQQLRVLSQVYNEAAKQQIVIDERVVPVMEYEGGYVYDPTPGLYKLIPCFDFKSLYPTIMISHNIDYRTFVPPEMMDSIPDDQCHVIEWDEEIEKKETDNDDDDDEDETKVVKTIHYKYKFVKKEVMPGILPGLLIKLISERDAIREEQEKYEKGSVEWVILEQRQLALKVSANSTYGALGAQKGGKLPLPEAAAAITAKARESTKRMNHTIESDGHTVVYGDTDSTMPSIGITEPTKAYATAKLMAKSLSALYPAPMKVELEEVYYTMLCIKKKMYLCIRMTPDGVPILDKNKLKVRGVVPARRDNCKYQRDSYLDVAFKVLTNEPMMEVYNYIIEICLKLMRREISWENLVVVKGLGSHYKNKSYCMKVFSDELCKIGKPAAPGDRLEYVIVNSYGIIETQLLGLKMRLPSTYLERAETETPENIDYVYYMEKTLMNCIQKQLFQIGYKKELAELQRTYINKDRTKVLESLRSKGYGLIVDQVMAKMDYDKEKVIEYLLNTELAKIVKPLVSYHIVKRNRIDTRIHGEPIKMMVKLIRQKQKCMDELKLLKTKKPKENKKKKPPRLNIMFDPKIIPANGNQEMKDKWIHMKTVQLKTLNKI
jgi:DNA polymerase elongation subunit (family B)